MLSEYSNSDLQSSVISSCTKYLALWQPHWRKNKRGLEELVPPQTKEKAGCWATLKYHVYRQEVDTDCVWHDAKRDWYPSNNINRVLENHV